jgi:branched-chain amino acid transport system ATP-binding protein
VIAAGSPAPLVATGVSVRFGGVVAVNDVSLTATPGEIVGLIGPNGAGKSTLLNCLSGVTRPTAGRVSIGERDITRWSVAKRSRAGLGRTFQHIRLFPSLTVGQNLEVALTSGPALALAGGHRARANGAAGHSAEVARESLQRFGVERLYNSEVSRLSPGQKRLVELARLVGMQARILLLDEPSSGLNVSEASNLYDVIQSLQQTERVIVIVEHRLKTITAVADRLLVLDRGAAIASGSTAEVIKDPAVRNAYLGEQTSA